MADNLPLLIFPKAKLTPPETGKGFGQSQMKPPTSARLQRLSDDFIKFNASVGTVTAGSNPEQVLVMELAKEIYDLQTAIKKIAGLEWLGEWDIDLEEDEDFQTEDGKSIKKGRLFVSMVNEAGMKELLSLWDKWQKNKKLPYGKGKWEEIFECLKILRRWGIEETLRETEMIEYFDNYLDEASVNFQIECFYFKDIEKRRKVEMDIRKLVTDDGGEILGNFIDMHEIAFHAVKAKMNAGKIRKLISENERTGSGIFISPYVMFFRQAGQAITISIEDESEITEYPIIEYLRKPVAAILDGVPNLQHEALKTGIDFDDPFDLAGKYQLGERKHGTAMASLILHGDRSILNQAPIKSKLYHIAVMQPNEQARAFGEKIEHFPIDCFYEDRIEQAVRRMLENDGTLEAQTPTVKIINLSLGDNTRPFIHVPSPWARLLDYLAWKYRILFCVSAGNYTNSYDFEMPLNEYNSKNTNEKSQLYLEAIQNKLSSRRLLAPAESINSLTVGALHDDESRNYNLGNRIDIVESSFISPISRVGHGFRNSVKPEIYFPGGRQLYDKASTGTSFKLNASTKAPGQQVASDSNIQGDNASTEYTRGTSNATALATRGAIQIYEVLEQLNADNDNNIPENLIAVVIKALLVHASVQNTDIKEKITNALQLSGKMRKKQLARYLGYGETNIERVLSCTEQRGTVIGFGEIDTNYHHEYRFPIPNGLAGKKFYNRMVITLAWFSPINPNHRNLREAKLELKPLKKWKDTVLKLERIDGDHNQVKRGTIQHEVLESEKQLTAFTEDEEIVFKIICKKDATSNVDSPIPYGLAVTFEDVQGVGISVYEDIQAKLQVQTRVTV